MGPKSSATEKERGVRAVFGPGGRRVDLAGANPIPDHPITIGIVVESPTKKAAMAGGFSTESVDPFISGGSEEDRTPDLYNAIIAAKRFPPFSRVCSYFPVFSQSLEKTAFSAHERLLMVDNVCRHFPPRPDRGLTRN